MILISLMQAWDRVTLDGDGDAEVGENGLNLLASLHPAEAFLGDRTSKQVEDFDRIFLGVCFKILWSDFQNFAGVFTVFFPILQPK